MGEANVGGRMKRERLVGQRNVDWEDSHRFVGKGRENKWMRMKALIVLVGFDCRIVSWLSLLEDSLVTTIRLAGCYVVGSINRESVLGSLDEGLCPRMVFHSVRFV